MKRMHIPARLASMNRNGGSYVCTHWTFRAAIATPIRTNHV